MYMAMSGGGNGMWGRTRTDEGARALVQELQERDRRPQLSKRQNIVLACVTIAVVAAIVILLLIG